MPMPINGHAYQIIMNAHAKKIFGMGILVIWHVSLLFLIRKYQTPNRT